MALIAERGARVTLEEIASRAGVSRQSVYVHFASRAGLLLAVVQHVDASGRLDALLDRAFNAASALDALDAVVHLHGEYSPEAYPVARAIMVARHEDEALGAAWDDRIQGRRNLYRFVVDWLAQEGLLDGAWDSEAAIDMLSALTSWQVWEQLIVDLGWSKEQYMRYLGTTVRRALLAGHVPSG